MERKMKNEIKSFTIRFAGDSGDGMQLVGTRLTETLVVQGIDVSTLPDYPAEIRAPGGTVSGVSGYQMQFADHDIYSPGDTIDCLVAMNPAALKKCIADVAKGALVIVNEDAFTEQNLEKAGYENNPFADDSLIQYRIIKIPATSLTLQAVEGIGLQKPQAERCKNFFMLGLALWLLDCPIDATKEWISSKFKKNPQVLEANQRAFSSGYAYGDTKELSGLRFTVNKMEDFKAGTYINLSGNEAAAYGLVAAAESAGRRLFFGAYPITPASDIMQELAALPRFNVSMFQAEDEIAAVCAAIGASFGGAIAAAGTSGPGLCLKTEGINLAVIAELPLVVIDVQRGGPSTGLPTKTEQSDLLQALFGRSGESPVVVIAPQTPSDCFHSAYEAVRLAVHAMTPVIMLSDGYIGNGTEPFRIPEEGELPPIKLSFEVSPEKFQPYLRDPETLSRPWCVPGTPGYEHRIGGLEKQDVTGAVSYEPDNHDRMNRIRLEKIMKLQSVIPDQEIFGEEEGELLIVGWGGTFGSIRTAVEELRNEGVKVSHAQIKYLNPFPKNLGDILKRFKKILVPEINLGQLAWLLRAKYLIEPHQLNLLRGLPLKISDVKEKAIELLEAVR
ncbi:TPA: 2-oxoglutarate ferredoxin oxidoreductase subunit alpha [bacterium]|nr:MAG: 2-oxoglutarate ferredoxin oxidoreductase subunit alpha [Candidatus Hydrogenedentes bacterium CG07_land_8_20_14_0_80_42_17]HBW47345.1 2-oxoglutarate ferredoxin oxidoreductase subunit alpha [bacterium]